MRRADDGRWELPAGAIDPGESPATAVAREVHEETGLIVDAVEIAAVLGPRTSRYPNGDHAEYTCTVFRCVVTGGVLAPLDGEASDLGWFAREELPRTLSFSPEVAFWRSGDAVMF